jgi:hypothetical protein
LFAESSRYNGAPEAERLLISQVALCWLRLNLVEHGCTSNTSDEHSLTIGIYWEKRLTAVQKRYTRAVESLAKGRACARALGKVSPRRINHDCPEKYRAESA